MLTGIVAVIQLLGFRSLLKLQSHNFIGKDVNLTDISLLLPTADNIETLVRILMDLIRITEESVKEIAISRNLWHFLEASGILILFSM